ncbi:MAG: TonB-dependent receptor [Verrucomicrobiota bacterium]|nr:TonB-dependent receptor [Verrucomicrobiota bacterium]
MELDLEKLAEVEVTSVSKKAQKLSDAAAAISVLSNEDIRRSGATSIPEALRLVPGLNVAQVDGQTWAISSRGFNSQFANKLLVMIDGRSVYTPLFSGVYWDVQNVVLEDVDRIEVIRGPGATVWGANAVNGVINIVTKSAKETQGGLVSIASGTEKTLLGALRYGGQINDQTFIRVYSKYDLNDDTALPGGSDANDRYKFYQGGFRLDWYPSDHATLTFQGDVYTGEMNQTTVIPTPSVPGNAVVSTQRGEVDGGNLLARWSRVLSEGSELSLQLFYDRTERMNARIGEKRDVFDIEFQHHFALGERNNLIYGAGYRRSMDETTGTGSASFMPADFNADVLSAFVQDEFAILEEELTLTLGTKVEHNDFTGVEVQPSARLSFKPTAHQTFWSSVSRAVRTPSRAEDAIGLDYAAMGPTTVRIFGGQDFKSEEVIAYELGYRNQLFKWMSWDLALFYNQYDNLSTVTPLIPALAPVLPIYFVNALEGETYGGEFSLTIQSTDFWRIIGSYALLKTELHRTFPNISETTEQSNPIHSIVLRNSVDLGRDVQFDVTGRYVDEVEINSFHIEKYFSADARLAWKPTKNLELSIVGQQLLDAQHPEFAPILSPLIMELERSVYGKLVFQF